MDKTTCIVGACLALALVGCSKPKAAQWQRISADAAEPAFYLDTANIQRTAGTPYVILQTRYTDGRYGMIRAESNCARRVLEPTALKEDVYGRDGQKLEDRMVTMSGEDEQAVLKLACSGS